LVPTKVNLPKVDVLIDSVRLADVPEELIEAAVTTTPDGVNAKVEPVKLTPVTVMFATRLASKDLGAIERMTGMGITVKLFGDVAVEVPTVTVMNPLVAPEGTVTVRVVALALKTVAGTPLNFTVFADGVAPKPCPWMVTVASTGAWRGVTLKMVSVPGRILERLICMMLPTGS
jgi:hypothetical protein